MSLTCPSHSCVCLLGRNKALETKGVRPPKATSTGTTIVGVLFKVQTTTFIDWHEHRLKYIDRMVFVSVLTREQLKVPSWLTRTAKRFTTLHPTCKEGGLRQLRWTFYYDTSDQPTLACLFFFSYCCGAGTAADTEATTNLISSQIELHSLSTGRKPRVVTAMTMLKQMLFRYYHHCGMRAI